MQIVDDVAPYELMKLRLLNASHQGLAYPGLLTGHVFAHEAATDPAVESICITLYRTNKASKIVRLLLKAHRNGKRVLAMFSDPYCPACRQFEKALAVGGRVGFVAQPRHLAAQGGGDVAVEVGEPAVLVDDHGEMLVQQYRRAVVEAGNQPPERL